jgi:hypothetical protein
MRPTGARVKPYYTLSEYAALTGATLRSVQRRADRGTLATGRVGKYRVVYLVQIQAENPDLWASIALALQVAGKK